MKKYGEVDFFSLGQMGVRSLMRLMMLSLTLGGISAIIWWRLNAPEYAFYYLFQYYYSALYCRIPFICSQVAQNNVLILQPFIDKLGELVRSCGVVFASSSVVCAIGLRFFFFGTAITSTKPVLFVAQEF